MKRDFVVRNFILAFLIGVLLVFIVIVLLVRFLDQSFQ